MPNSTQPSSPAPPACSKCHRTTCFQRAPHSSGDGWHIRAWCESCRCDAIPEHRWWSRRLFAPEQLAALPLQPESPSTQLSLLEATNDNHGRDR